jgi:hypothetical protein
MTALCDRMGFLSKDSLDAVTISRCARREFDCQTERWRFWSLIGSAKLSGGTFSFSPNRVWLLPVPKIDSLRIADPDVWLLTDGFCCVYLMTDTRAKLGAAIVPVLTELNLHKLAGCSSSGSRLWALIARLLTGLCFTGCHCIGKKREKGTELSGCASDMSVQHK